MNKTSLIQQARIKKQKQVMAYLKKAFKDFAYPVYLFGSYATGQFHGYSDIDILIISPDALSTEVHRLACDKMAELGMDYDILISSSLERLDVSLVSALQMITATAPGAVLSPDLNAIDKSNAATLPGAVDPHRRQLGMTLIEIMIALLIGAFLLGGVMQIFVSSQQTNRMQENLSRLQENGRFALEFISKDIRRAGYWGCLRPSSPDIDVAGTDSAANGDTLTLRGAFVQVPIGACGDSVDTTAIYYTDPSSTITYLINGSVLQQNTNGQNNGLIEGIEDMQILYGVDTNTDGAANYYVSANNVANMFQVISIRISLLAATLDDNLAAQPLTYTYNGVTTTAADLRIRRVFNTTVAVRNRQP